MDCPKCESEKILTISSTYPKTFECQKCGHTFMQNPRALVDE